MKLLKSASCFMKQLPGASCFENIIEQAAFWKPQQVLIIGLNHLILAMVQEKGTPREHDTPYH